MAAELVAPFLFQVRVYYEDTDAGGVVYHAGYLRFAERGRTEMLRGLGLDHGRLLEDYGLVFAVRRCEVDYLRPARLDDLLDVVTRIARLGGASLDLIQEIGCAGTPVARLAVRLALIDQRGRAARLPEILRRAITGAATAAESAQSRPTGER